MSKAKAKTKKQTTASTQSEMFSANDKASSAQVNICFETEHWEDAVRLRVGLQALLAAVAHGAVSSRITSATVQTAPVLIPSANARRNFNDKASVWFQRILSNVWENTELIRNRNYLLPKLLSGEVEVKAAKEVTEVV